MPRRVQNAGRCQAGNACASGSARLIYVLVIAVLWPIVMTLVYAVVPPPASNVMILRLFTGNGLTYDWVSLDQISPQFGARGDHLRGCALLLA